MTTAHEFGNFRLEIDERQLFRGTEIVPLEPKAFDLLAYLVTHPNNLIEKQVLVEAVWARAAVTDNSLTRCIHQVRAALGDRADSPVYVETVQGSGYRFIAPVEIVNRDVPQQPMASSSRFRWPILITIGALGALIFLLMSGKPDGVRPISRIAVLPLANLTGDPEQAYVVDGIHDALINELGRLGDIDIISRTSAEAFRDSDLTLPEIAKQLSVDAIVEGSVSRNASDIAVALQVLTIEPERQLWADRSHHAISDASVIGRSIARAVGSALDVDTARIDRVLPPVDPTIDEASFDAYLQGRHHIQQFNADGFRKARAKFHEAMDIDPDFALPYVGQAHVLGASATFGLVSPADAYPEAQRLAERAIALYPDLADAHVVLGGVELYWDWNWTAAERHLRHAIELNPNLPSSYRMISEVLSITGRHDEAVAAIERGRSLDPLVAVSRFKPILILYLKGDYTTVIDRAEAELESMPQVWQGHWLLCLGHAGMGDYAAAAGKCEQATDLSGRTPMALGTLGYVGARAGETGRAREILAELNRMRRRQYVGPATIAIVHGALGETDEAFALLEDGFRERDPLLIHIDNYRFFDPLRADARFDAFRNRIIRQP